MLATLTDAHCHYTDPELSSRWRDVRQTLEAIGLAAAVVNGTHPEDWPTVIAACADDPLLIPAIGVHPWRANELPPDWQTRFRDTLSQGCSVIGETGLDQWMPGHDIERQRAIFEWELELAADANLPLTIHCLHAWEPLLEILKRGPIPERGIHLHAFNGSEEIMRQLVAKNAVFSFNSGQMVPAKKKLLALMKTCPAERLLLETDAPAFVPPDHLNRFPLSTTSGRPLNHPANLAAAYSALAELRGETVDRLATTVGANFKRFFLDAG